MCHNVELDMGICSAIIAENPHLVISKNQSAISMENGYQKIKAFRVNFRFSPFYSGTFQASELQQSALKFKNS
jgi:hypothetical protein